MKQSSRSTSARSPPPSWCPKPSTSTRSSPSSARKTRRRSSDKSLRANKPPYPAWPIAGSGWRVCWRRYRQFLKLSGTDAIQFFIADGKYRKQVFALARDAEGTIAVYVPDMLEDAILREAQVAPNADAETENSYRLPEAGPDASPSNRSTARR